MAKEAADALNGFLNAKEILERFVSFDRPVEGNPA